MVESYESVVSRVPFRIRRRVRWSECDPAGVVYTGKFTDFLLGAVNLFYANLVDMPYREFMRGLGIDTPCRGLEMDFRGALWPEDEFQIAVAVGEVRKTSFDLRLHATREGGEDVFFGRFTPICIPRGGERKSVAIPPAYLEALQKHRLEPRS